jgi:hypothetical protein
MNTTRFQEQYKVIPRRAGIQRRNVVVLGQLRCLFPFLDTEDVLVFTTYPHFCVESLTKSAGFFIDFKRFKGYTAGRLN